MWATGALVLVNVAFFIAFLLRPPRSGSSGGDIQSAPAVSGRLSGQPGVYAVKGVVVEVRDGGTNMVVRHEAIPGFMPAMTMPFQVRDPRETASVHSGDVIAFRLLVTDSESWIDSVQKSGGQESPAAFPYEQSRIVRDVEPLEIGQVIPDYPFTNELGAPVKLGDYRGKAVALTFVFTRCPLPDFCPRMLKNFSAVAAGLESRAGGVTNWQLLAVTIDPVFDTVPVLKAHADRNQYVPAHWSFLTGAQIEIDALTEQVGLAVRRQTPAALPDHNLRTILIDPKGRLRKIIIGNTWKPEEVIDEMARWARETG